MKRSHHIWKSLARAVVVSRAAALVLILCAGVGCRTKPPASVQVTPITKPEKPIVAAEDRSTSGSEQADLLEMRPVNPQMLGEGARLLVGREFEPIYFETSSTELNSEARRRLTEYVNWLKQPEHAHVWVALVGYCDTQHSARFGFDLAMARAFAVEEFLVANGFDRRRIYSIGYGRANEEPTSNRVEVLGFVGPQNEEEMGKAPAEAEEAPEPEPEREVLGAES